MKRLYILLIVVISAKVVWAQKPMQIQIKEPVICYAAEKDNHFHVPPPEAYLKWKSNPVAKVQANPFQFEFVGFESAPAAQAAFEKAAEIWSTLISTTVPIKIKAEWKALGAGVLGSAIYSSAFANFEGAQKLNVYYPIALAEKITGEELNPGEPDIYASFNSSTNWHFDPNTTPPSGKFDLVTVVLHEIGHGLGFAGTFNVAGTNGTVGFSGEGAPIIYDVPIENGADKNLIEGFTSPSASLRTQLISGNLFFDSQTSGRPKLYAPSPFDAGSSISHLDEATFGSAGNNALMTPQIAPVERIHNPGIALNMLRDLGWETINIIHQRLPNTENISGPYTVVARIKADAGYDNGSVKLHYSLNNGLNYTEVQMVPTANPDEYSFTIPSSGLAQFYRYFISVNKNINLQYTNPGKIVSSTKSQVQFYHRFETGPDDDAPIIKHTQKFFLLTSDTTLKIDARISDNIGIASTVVEYSRNNIPQSPQPMTLVAPGKDSVYTVVLALGTLLEGDIIKYKIKAADNAVNSGAGPNQTMSPATGDYEVNVVSLKPTQDSYANDFNSPSNDFFGNGFSIAQPTGFSNGAIHSIHPYIEGEPFDGDTIVFVYQLKVPIKVKKQDALIRFDEIVLVEPGDAGSVFGDSRFYDYVVVEGSLDGGVNWTHLENGYDSRANPTWLTKYNSAINSNDLSTAVGDPTLFKPREINMLSKYAVGNEVVLRFKLYSDQLAAGWGWAIDNLKIQIDDTPPLVLHDHIDYLKPGEPQLLLTTKVSDASGVKSLKIEFSANGGVIQEQIFNVNPPSETYTLNITLDGFIEGDYIEYRITAIDSADNQNVFPTVGSFTKVPIINFQSAVTTYSNNFNSPTNDFVGNFFSVSQPGGFTDGAIHSSHFYPTGVGLNRASNFVYTLLKPITVAASNSYIRFDEVALVEGHTTGVVFGNPNFKDYVIVEGSKDNGVTWLPLLNGYDIVGQSDWISAFNGKSNGSSSLYKTRAFDIKANGNFLAGDNVVIRFRLFSNETINGWGWAIDNLYIQDPITGTENDLSIALKFFPNPAKDKLFIQAESLSHPIVTIQLMNMHGQNYYSITKTVTGELSHEISLKELPKGLYLLKVSNGTNTAVKKVIKTD